MFMEKSDGSTECTNSGGQPDQWIAVRGRRDVAHAVGKGDCGAQHEQGALFEQGIVLGRCEGELSGGFRCEGTLQGGEIAPVRGAASPGILRQREVTPDLEG
jgi:hypothetical protein